jgi:hypothetical protein
LNQTVAYWTKEEGQTCKYKIAPCLSLDYYNPIELCTERRISFRFHFSFFSELSFSSLKQKTHQIVSSPSSLSVTTSPSEKHPKPLSFSLYIYTYIYIDISPPLSPSEAKLPSSE